MPDEAFWENFFDADRLVDLLVVDGAGQGDVAEFGSGYGTFTIPAARRISGKVYGFDIEQELIALIEGKCKRLGIGNVRLETRDFVEQGTGLPAGSIVHVMIYNLLHIENPVGLLTEAFRILEPGGIASVIHWRCDIPTPRGPSPDIRPKPEQCIQWGIQAGFQHKETMDISEAAPYHYGLWFYKATNPNNQEAEE